MGQNQHQGWGHTEFFLYLHCLLAEVLGRICEQKVRCKSLFFQGTLSKNMPYSENVFESTTSTTVKAVSCWQSADFLIGILQCFNVSLNEGNISCTTNSPEKVINKSRLSSTRRPKDKSYKLVKGKLFRCHTILRH